MGMAIAFSLTFIDGCKKNDLTSQQTNKTKKSWDETTKAVAKDVSVKLKSLSFRKMLKHEVWFKFLFENL